MKLILASASPRRKQLLRKLGLPFHVKVSHVSEATSLRHPVHLVRELARRKALAVASTVKAGLVLGADTVVVSDGKILGKPKDARAAYAMLYRLSGTTHRVYTGVCLIDAARKKQWVVHAVSHVRMRKLSIEELLRLSQRHLDKAGAYAIQEKRDPIARVVKGSYDNVVGLPLACVKALLGKHGRVA